MIAEVARAEDLHLRVIRMTGIRRDREGVHVQLRDVLDLRLADLLALVAEGLAQLLPLIAGVQQDHRAA